MRRGVNFYFCPIVWFKYYKLRAMALIRVSFLLKWAWLKYNIFKALNKTWLILYAFKGGLKTQSMRKIQSKIVF